MSSCAPPLDAAAPEALPLGAALAAGEELGLALAAALGLGGVLALAAALGLAEAGLAAAGLLGAAAPPPQAAMPTARVRDQTRVRATPSGSFVWLIFPPFILESGL
ncbi:MAG TPA: hypothetical protein VIR57_20715 [Chloroflexota bacterium]